MHRGDESEPDEAEHAAIARMVAAAPADGSFDADLVADTGEERARRAWCRWLSALATDAESAMAAGLAYESLDAEAREAWLDVLDEDAPELGIPPVALYAPLIAVETDERRRARIVAALSASAPRASHEVQALRGLEADGTVVGVFVSPVYLDFVEVLACRYRPHHGVVSATHDPLLHRADIDAICSGDAYGLALEPTPVHFVVEELAHAIVADGREKRDPPTELARFAYLFGPDVADSVDVDGVY